MKRSTVIAFSTVVLILSLLTTIWRWRRESSAQIQPAHPASELASVSADQSRPAPKPPQGPVRYLDKVTELSAWAVPYGREFWRAKSTSKEPLSLSGNGPAPAFDLGSVIDRVSHAFSAAPGDSVVRAHDLRFGVELSEAGLTLMPARYTGTSLGNGSPTGMDPAERVKPQAQFAPDASTRAVFQTTRVQVGGEAVYDGAPRQYEVVGNVAQALLHESSGLVEHYAVQSEGVEVSWILAQRPASGGVTVEARLDGVQYEAQEGNTTFFTDAQGERRVRVGAVELVDANGVRTAIPAQWTGNQLRVDVSAEQLAQSAFPVAIDPVVGPAFQLLSDLEPFSQVFQQAAWNGTNYLFVWKNYYSEDMTNFVGSIRGTIVNATGSVVTLGGFTIRDVIEDEGNSDTCFYPTVASAGGQFLVVWEDIREHGSDGMHGDLYMTRVSNSGTVENPDGVVCVANPYVPDGYGYFADRDRALLPRAASNGTNYFVIWTQWLNDTNCAGCQDIHGVMVSGGGSAGSQFVVYSNAARYEGWANATSDGTNYMAIWGTTDDGWYHHIGARPVSAAGSLGTFFEYDDYEITWSIPRIAYSKASGNYLTTFWSIWDFYTLKCSRFLADGSLVSPSAVTVGYAGEMGIASDGTNYLVTYGANGSIVGKRVSASTGSVMDSTAVLISCSRSPFWLESTYGYDYVVSWTDGTWYTETISDLTTNDIWMTRVAFTNQPLICKPVSVLSQPSTTSGDCSVAYNNGKYMIVWNTSASGDYDVKGTLLTGDGFPLTPNGINIITATGTQRQPNVAAFTSTSNALGYGFFVSWVSSASPAGTYGTRVSSHGSVMDSGGILLGAGSGCLFPSAVAINSTLLVVWQHLVTGGYHIKGARVTPGGTVLDSTPLAINNGTGSQRYPRVSTLGTDFMVVWSEAHASGRDIYATRTDTSGAILDATPVRLAGTGGSRDNPRISPSATYNEYVVVWDNYLATSVYAGRLTSSCSSVDSSPIMMGSGLRPAVAYFTGGQNLVVWVSSSDIRGARLDTSTGASLDASPIPIDISPGTQSIPDIVNAGARCLVSFASSGWNARFVLP